jgi:hypothetical protein
VLKPRQRILKKLCIREVRSEPALKIIHTLSPSAPGGLFASDAPLAGAQHRQVVERFFSPVAKLPHAWQLIERLECQIICRHAGDVVPACASGQIKPHSIAAGALACVKVYCLVSNSIVRSHVSQSATGSACSTSRLNASPPTRRTMMRAS